jgi:anti-anti-sigma factor
VNFSADLTIEGETALIRLSGELDANTAPNFFDRVTEAAQTDPERLVLVMDELEYMASAGLRGLAFARQKMGDEVEILVVGANDAVAQTIRLTGFEHSVVMSDRY